MNQVDNMSKYKCRKPGPKSVKFIKEDVEVTSPSLTREYSFVYKKAKGMHIFDVDGRKYLDFTSSVAVMNIGHTNPDVVRAMRKQMKLGFHCGFSDFYAETPVRFCRKLVSMLSKGLDKVFLSNSGTESVEAAYKLARYVSNKKWTIAFNNSFHGRTMGSLSLTNSKPIQKKRYNPFLPVDHAPFPNPYRMDMEHGDCSNSCLSHLEDVMRKRKDNLAAVFIEPVQGEGGYVIPPKDFLPGVRRLCDEYGAFLCVDEVQSGCFRTGKFLAIENFGVQPDIVSMSKAIGGGVPLGATIASKNIMDEWPRGSHANTFGGNLLACAGGIAALDFMKNEKLGQNALKMGKYFMKRLNQMVEEFDHLGEVRGLGLMIGLEIVRSKASKAPDEKFRKALLCDCEGKGLLLLPAGESAIRIAPPLIISREQAEKGLDILEDSLRSVSKDY
jgi:4-aminobutyrate aminotransferase